MTSLLENISKRVGEVAQAAAKKSSYFVEITRLGMNISVEEEKIQQIHEIIGKKLSEEYSSNKTYTNNDFAEELEKIKEYEKNIATMKAKILELKDLKSCSSCKKEITKTSKFCDQCGNKQEEVEIKEEKAVRTCSTCSAEVNEDAIFCASCGEKLNNE